MARKLRRTQVRYRVSEPVEIEEGVLLPAGSYAGTMEEGGIDTMLGVQWMSPQYRLELSADELESMGRKNHPSIDSIDYDLAPFVRSGKIEVS